MLDLIYRLLAMLSSSIRARRGRHDSKTGARGGKRAHVRAKRGSRASRPCVHSSRASSSGHRQDSPCNRPVSDPGMAHLP